MQRRAPGGATSKQGGKTPDRWGSRTHYPHAYLWKAATRCLQRAEAEEAGSFYEAMLAIVGAVFALEAYLNFAGPRVVKDWTEKDEWTSVKDKLKRLRRAGVQVDTRGGAYRTVLQSIEVRNRIAHGKPQTIEAAWAYADEGLSGGASLDADWMRACTPEAARALLAGVEAVIRTIHATISPVLGPFDEFASGESSGSGGLEDEFRRREAR